MKWIKQRAIVQPVQPAEPITDVEVMASADELEAIAAILRELAPGFADGQPAQTRLRARAALLVVMGGFAQDLGELTRRLADPETR